MRLFIILKIKNKKMTKEKLYEWIVPGLVLIILAGLLIYYQSEKIKVLAGFIGEGYRQTSTTLTTAINMTNTGQAVASSTQVIAANDSRRFARCYNTSTTGQPLSFMLGSTATSSTLLSGLIVFPVASTTVATPDRLELNEDNPFTGAVYAYAQATGTAMCVEN